MAPEIEMPVRHSLQSGRAISIICQLAFMALQAGLYVRGL